MKWENEQLDIISAPISHLSVLACAGSGKTAVVIERVARLIEKKGLDADKISVITFTELAAAELSERFHKRLEKSESKGRPFTGTIHSFCLRFLRELDPVYGASVKVLSEGKQFALLYRKFEDWNLSSIAPDLTSKTKIVELAARTLDIAELDQIDPARLKAHNRAFYDAQALYKEWCEQTGYLDFAHMLTRFSRELAANRTFLAHVVAHVSYLVVDEYQDTDPVQERIFAQLSKSVPVMVVGDDDQCIYQFRGTTVDNILGFAKRFKSAEEKYLSKNFRCGSNIVAAASAVALRLSKRRAKKLTHHWRGGNIHVRSFRQLGAEAADIAGAILRYKEKGEVKDFSDIAILMRSVASYSQPYVDALKDHGIPFIIRGDRRLFESLDIEACLQLLEVISHPESRAEQLRRLLIGIGLPNSVPLVGTNDAHDDFDDMQVADWQALGVSGGLLARVDTVLGVRQRYRDQKYSSCLDIFIRTIVAADLFTARADELGQRNLARLSEIIFDYDEVTLGRNLRYLINYLKAYASRKFDSAQAPEPESGAVNILTVHQAKGLEFDIVFCPMLVAKRFPLAERGLSVALDPQQFDLSRYKTREEDERRLFYVALTRARKSLHISAASDIGLQAERDRSVFFQELADHKRTAWPMPQATRATKSFLPTFSSYSKIEYYLTCPYRYKLLFDISICTPPNAFFEFGKVMHLALRMAHDSYRLGKPLTADEVVGIYSQNFPQIRNVPKLTVSKIKRRAENAIRQYMNRHVAWLKGTISTELPFELILRVPVQGSDQPVHVLGQIDLVSNEGAPVLTDFKTGAPHDYIRTDLQLQVYSLAMQQNLGITPAKARVFYVEEDKSVEYEVTREWLNKGNEILEDALSGIVEGNFSPTPGEVCIRCEVRELCVHRM